MVFKKVFIPITGTFSTEEYIHDDKALAYIIKNKSNELHRINGANDHWLALYFFVFRVLKVKINT